jgi:hypothetical protein
LTNLELNVWEALKIFRKEQEHYILSTHREDERDQLLSLENFAIYLTREWARYIEVGTK